MKNLVSRLKKAVVIGTLAAFVSGCQPYVRQELSNEIHETYIEPQVHRSERVNSTQSNDIFDGLSSIASVEEYPVQDSKHTLVHVKQRHMTDVDSANPVFVARVEKNQGDIYEILKIIYGKNPDIQLYPEGLTVEKEVYLNDLAVKEKIRLRNYFSYLVLDDPLDRKLFWENLDSNVNFCGLMLFGMDKELPLYAPELSSINKLAKQKYRDGIKGKELFDDREDFALQRIHETLNKEIAITDFGCDHNFLDNVNRWDAKYPHDKFSLVVIKPHSLRKKGIN